MTRTARSCAAALLACLACPAAVYGHAALTRSDPPAHAVVAGGAGAFVLEFNCRIDAARSLLALSGPARVTLPAPAQTAPNQMSSSHKTLVRGSYVLRWEVLATDGHVTRGEVPFEVR